MSSFFMIGFSYAKHFFSSHSHITDQVFRLHHQVTTPILLTMALATAVSEVTASMSCYADAGDLSEDLLNTYCWMQNTFVLPDATGAQLGIDVSQQGVDKHVPGETRLTFQRYYQWIPYMLLCQAICFYLPYYVWKSVENGRVKRLLLQQDKYMVAASEPMLPRQEDIDHNDEKATPHRIVAMAEYLAESWNHWFNLVLPVVYLLCVLLALLNVSVQLYLVDRFMNYEFSRLNWGLLGAVHSDVSQRNDTLLTVFPRMAKCSYRQYGAAGSVVFIDAVCVLPFNIFYERVYVYCWFWFLVMVIISAAHALYCLLNVVLRQVRMFTLRRFDPLSDRGELDRVLSVGQSNVGDWFFLLLLSWNVHCVRFGKLVSLLEKKLTVTRNNRNKEE